MQKFSRINIGTLVVVMACLIASLSSLPVARAQQGLSQSSGSGVEASAPDPAPAMPTAIPIDATPPWITQPGDLFAAAPDAAGAIVTYLLPAAGDESGKPVTVGCNWPSGSLFPLGQTLVTCTARDAAGNPASVTFRITVTDQTAPVIPAMANIVVDAVDPAGAVVAFNAPVAWDNVNGSIVAACDPVSGAFFPVGTTLVTCYATDFAGNHASPVGFSVTVNAPVIPPTEVPAPTAVPTLPPTPTPVPTEVVVPTPEPTSLPTEVVTPDSTAVPTNVVTPEPTEGATEAVTPEPTIGETPAPSSKPVESGTPVASDDGDTPPTGTVEPDLTPTEESSTVVPSPTATPSLTPTVAPTVVPTEPVPDALSLPWPPPGNFVINTYGGPLNGIDAIWGYESFPISQEFGHTEFSILHFAWYAYGIALGLDGYEHPGLDVGMPAGTWLYSPVEGTVRTSGNTPYFTYYGNGAPNVGELRIVTDEGHEIILGHMGAISVNVGDRVEVGQFVGVSGGYNGDHLHLEVLEVQWGGWHRAVDPRKSFIVDVIEEAAKARDAEQDVDAVLPGTVDRQRSSSRHVGSRA
jgi:murein DD-endopeptidase MepM/ murein hydrolase activator NlpD